MQREELSMEHRDKHTHFSIRKFNLGVASVAVATFFLFSGSVVSATSQAEIADGSDHSPTPTSSEISPLSSPVEEVKTNTDNGLESGVSTAQNLVSGDDTISSEKQLDPVTATDGRSVFRAAVDVSDKAKDADGKTKGIFFKPAKDVTITEVDGEKTNELPTKGFSTTEPTVYNMQTGRPGTNASTPKTVYHDQSKLTFAVIYTAHHGNYYNPYVGHEDSGQIWFGNKSSQYNGQYYYKKWWNDYTRVDQIAFATDKDGTGNIYVTYYSGTGEVVKQDVFYKGKYETKTYSYKDSEPRYHIYYYAHTEPNGTVRPAVAVQGPHPEGWFNELYNTTFTAPVTWLTLNRHLSYGWYVPELVSRETRYIVKDTKEQLGTIIQREMAGYTYKTAAPTIIKANGKIYKLIEGAALDPTGTVNPFVKVGDTVSSGNDYKYIVHYELIDESGKVRWILYDDRGKLAVPTGNNVNTGILETGQTTTTTVQVPEYGKPITYWIAHPYRPAERTIYYYKEVQSNIGSVVVRYEDEKSKPIKEDKKIKEGSPVGENYDATTGDNRPKTIVHGDKTYVLTKETPKEGSAAPIGKVEEGEKVITYVYGLTGQVSAQYFIQNTETKLAKDKSVKEAGSPLGQVYNDTPPVELVGEDGKKYELVRIGEIPDLRAGSALQSGIVKVEEQVIKYQYKLKEAPQVGSVVIKYIDTDGNVLQSQYVDTKDAPVGTEYNTAENNEKPANIIKDDKIYILASEGRYRVGEVGPDNNLRSSNLEKFKLDVAAVSGKIKSGQHTVTYVYKLMEPPIPTPEVKRGTVLVRHITEDGEALDETRAVVRDGKVGSGYITEAGQFDGYSLFKIDENGAPAQGLVKEGIQTVIYIYKKIETPAPTPEVKKGSVQVRYITEDNRVLEGPIAVKTNELVGTKYETVKKTFAGYTFVKVDENGALAQGLVKEGTQIVTYIYRKIETPIPAPSPEVKTGSVVARYVIQGTEMTIAANTIVKPAQTPVDELYSDTPPIAIRFAGKEYILLHTRNKAGDAPQTGKVIEGKQIITYEYKEVAKTPAPAPEVKKGSVQVLYITEDGQVLEGPTAVQTNEPVGTIYTTEQKVFSGYTFVKVDEAGASTTGIVEEGTKIVTYIYKKDETAPTPPSVEVPLMSPTPTTPVARAVPKTAILPATGENNSALALVGIALLGAVAVASHRRKKK